MWANSDDEDTPGFGSSRRKKKDYTAPIGFVSGGIKQGSKIKKEGEEDDSSVNTLTCLHFALKIMISLVESWQNINGS